MQGALSEAFADLLAYYSEGATGASLLGLPGIGKNRDIAGASFVNGDDKILTEDRLGVLFGLRDEGEVSGRRAEVLADIHIVGAILSHTADQLFQTLTRTRFTPGSPEDVNQRYKMVLTWMDALVDGSAQLTSAQSGADVLQPLSLAFERVTDAFFGAFPLTDGGSLTEAKVRAELCTEAKELLPSLKAPPFASADGRCE